MLPYPFGFILFVQLFALSYLIALIWMFGWIVGAILFLLSFFQIVDGSYLWMIRLPWLIWFRRRAAITGQVVPVNKFVYASWWQLICVLDLLVIINFFVSGYASAYNFMREWIDGNYILFFSILIGTAIAGNGLRCMSLAMLRPFAEVQTLNAVDGEEEEAREEDGILNAEDILATAADTVSDEEEFDDDDEDDDFFDDDDEDDNFFDDDDEDDEWFKDDEEEKVYQARMKAELAELEAEVKAAEKEDYINHAPTPKENGTMGPGASWLRSWSEKRQSKPCSPDRLSLGDIFALMIWRTFQFGKKSKGLLTRYSGDSTIFEVACYMHFRIDLWLITSEPKSYYLADKFRDGFARLFKKALESEDIATLFNERVSGFGYLAIPKGDFKQYHKHLEQLMLRTRDNQHPEAYDFIDGPEIVGDLLETMSIRVELLEWEKTMLPPIFEMMKKYCDSTK